MTASASASHSMQEQQVDDLLTQAAQEQEIIEGIEKKIEEIRNSKVLDNLILQKYYHTDKKQTLEKEAELIREGGGL